MHSETAVLLEGFNMATKRPASPLARPPKKFQVDPDYTIGNFVLVTDDGVGFAIHDFYLKARSCVFREMIESLDSSQTAIDIPDTTYPALRTFVDACSSRIRPSLTWREAKGAIKLCEVYDCGELSRNLLFAVIPNLQHNDFCDAFIIAAQLSEVGMASHILVAQGQAPIWPSTYTAGSPIPLPTEWDRIRATQLPIKWYWALIQAEKGCKKEEERVTRQKYEYWLKFAGIFAKEVK